MKYFLILALSLSGCLSYETAESLEWETETNHPVDESEMPTPSNNDDYDPSAGCGYDVFVVPGGETIVVPLNCELLNIPGQDVIDPPPFDNSPWEINQNE